jgi:transcriptional regulator with XRE-family HTH domain
METENKKPHINVDYFEDLTGEIAASPKQDIEALGSRIQSIRQQKSISLEALSRLTGFDVDFLSKIETNQVQPQLGTLIRLSKALDSAFGRLISGRGDQHFAITRKDERKVISRSTSKQGQKNIYTYKSLAPEVRGRHMEALVVTLEENPDEDMSVHDGEEFIYVLDGVVSFSIGDEVFDLEPGDSVYYLSTTPHLIASKSGQATILAVLYEG